MRLLESIKYRLRRLQGQPIPVSPALWHSPTRASKVEQFVEGWLGETPLSDDGALSLPRSVPIVDVPCADHPARWQAQISELHGIFPISFAFPLQEDSLTVSRPKRTSLLSRVLPDSHYSYHEEKEYYKQYANSHFAITHRKNGWDAFRHVEIMAQGCVPLFLDINEAPWEALGLYPKKFLLAVLERCQEGPWIPGDLMRIQMQNYVLQYLSTTQLAYRILNIASTAGTGQVLFVDAALKSHADYQSVLTLIGLKQVLGRMCRAVFSPTYIYRDWQGDSRSLYGRGFGYSRVLDPSYRTHEESAHQSFAREYLEMSLKGRAARNVDLVVVGNYTRNRRLAGRLSRAVGPKRLVLIHGEDRPPSMEVVAEMSQLSRYVFVREIPTEQQWTFF